MRKETYQQEYARKAGSLLPASFGGERKIIKFKAASPKPSNMVWLLGLSITLAGCGGSGGSSQITTTQSDHVVLAKSFDFGSGGFSVTLTRSGAATYTVNEVGQSSQPSSGTVPSTLTSRFFNDLDAVAPTYQSPTGVIGGGVGAGSTNISYSGKTISVYNSNDARQQALHDDFYAVTKALGIPIPPGASM